MVSDFEVKFLLPDGSPASVTMDDDGTILVVHVCAGKFRFTFRMQFGHPYRTALENLNGDGGELDVETEAEAANVARSIFAGKRRRAIAVALNELMSFP